jgi:integrase
MPRPRNGSLTQLGKGASLRWRLRFAAGGKRRSLTLHARDGYTHAKAKDELHDVLASVRLGQWECADTQTVEPVSREVVTFDAVAHDWWNVSEVSFRASTRTDYRWRLNNHLLPWFGDRPVADITVGSCDEFRAHCVRESERRSLAAANGNPLRDGHGKALRPHSHDTINKWLALLQRVLDFALERGFIETNPMLVNARRRKLPRTKPARTYLDCADKIKALLDANSEVGTGALDHRRVYQRTVLSTFLFAGLRVGELCALRWKDVDCTNSTLRVTASKTDAGVRTLDLVPSLCADLAALRASATYSSSDDFVFATSSGSASRPDNIRARIVKPAAARASEALDAAGQQPLPEGITPHSLRRTCAGILIGIGWDVGAVMDHLGHADEGMTLSVYRQRMNRSESEKAALTALVAGTVDSEPRPSVEVN